MVARKGVLAIDRLVADLRPSCERKNEVFGEEFRETNGGVKNMWMRKTASAPSRRRMGLGLS